MSKFIHRFILTFMLAGAGMNATADPLSGQARQLYDRATQEARLAGISPEVVPTQDGRSFLLVWEPQALKGKPHQWIVSLHGSNGFATRDLEIWSPFLKDRNLGIISLQWWFGRGDKTQDYYSPFDIYRELDLLMRRMGVKPGDAMLEGFSRGSANLYAVAALDRNKGQRYFSLFVANSGRASLDYPPTRAVDTGKFGDMPYKGSRWITSCGERDTNPDRDGCPGMRRTAEWLKKLGGEIAFAIEDRSAGHGAFHLNPQNANRALDWFLRNPE